MARPRFAPLALVLALLLLLPASTGAQTQVEPGFNLFTEEQDIEVGRQSAEQVEQQLPMLHDREVTRYVDRLGARLAENAPGYDYPYQFDVVNVADLNAFALPGGFMYVNRGLIGAMGSESALAAVLAHEIAHVALRHGTNQASKAYLGDAGLSLLTGLIGGRSASDIVGAVGGFGLNSLFLKFSREDEREADIVGTQILARAGYHPDALAQAFRTIQRVADGSGGGGIPTFLSSHPPYDERLEIVRAEADRLGRVNLRRPLGDFERVQGRLADLDPAPSMESAFTHDPQTDRDDRSDDRRWETDPVPEQGSDEWETYTHPRNYFRIEHPDDWSVREASDHFGVTFVPAGGLVQLADGREEIVYGVLIDHFRPENVSSFSSRWQSGFTTDEDWRRPSDGTGWLESASNRLLETLRESNSHLTVQEDTRRTTQLDANAAYVVTLEGHNPVTDRRERVTVVTRETEGDGHLVYALLIAPEAQWGWMTETFDTMMNSLRVDDAAVHHSES